ncbi:MAG: LytR C-terminal domain-containing protein [Candidatus Peribacteria bacterium]|nr:LytR C-terminal domain-containing protein [Candidatus Peribacteria bacterium]
MNILNSTKTSNLASTLSNDFLKYGFDITKL